MTNQDTTKFAKLLAILGDTFAEPISELRIETYFEALSDMPIAKVQNAVKRAIRELDFFPKPAELRRLGGSLGGRVGPPGVEETRAIIKRIAG